MSENRSEDEGQLPALLVWSVLAASLVPQLLPLTGFHLILETQDGGHIHSLLEWSAVCASFLTAFLGFLYLRVRADYLVLTIALAALASGLWDALHALASLGLIAIATDLLRFVPFTWAVSRTLKALVLMLGTLALLRKARPRPRLGRGWLVFISVTTLVLTWVFLGLSVRKSLPVTYFPDAILKRPWDLPSFVLISINGAIFFPMLVTRRPGLLARALWLSAVPDVLSAAHMCFGSSGLYDYSFQLAHVLKLVACLVPFAAINLYFIRAFRGEQRLVRELKVAKEELLAKEERLNQLTENIREVFWISAADGSKMYYVSPAYEEIFGMSRDRLYERPDAYLDVLHPEDRKRLVALTRQDQDVDFDAEFRILRENGERRWLRIRAFPIRNEAGDVYRLAGLIEDVTEHKQAVEALRKSEARMRALLEAVPDLMFRLNRDGTIVDYHARDGLDLYKRPEEFLGRRMDAVLPGPGSRIVATLRATLDTGKMHMLEYRLNVQGMEKDFEARFVRSTEDEGLSLVRDITERKRLEKEVLDVSNRERHRIGHDLHDGISQQLTGIALLLKAVQQRLEGRSIPEALNIRQIEELVEDAIAQTRSLARGLAPVHLDVGGLPAALEELADGVEVRSPVRCRLVTDQEAHVHDQAVATHLYRIAQEAVTNAVRHANPSEILIALTRKGGRVSLSVRDDGTGFDAQSSGDGMGLHIMRYRARMIDGTLTISPAAGRGTLVCCEWPGAPG